VFEVGLSWTRNVTRVVSVHEIADARRRHMRRSRVTAEFAGALRVALNDPDDRS
jgi:hypothetical protein